MTAYLLKRRICTNGSAGERVNAVLFKGHDLSLRDTRAHASERKGGELDRDV